MKRTLVAVAFAAGVVALVLILRRPQLGPSPYVASDPALVGSTGRVQLVEFFHHA